MSIETAAGLLAEFMSASNSSADWDQMIEEFAYTKEDLQDFSRLIFVSALHNSEPSEDMAEMIEERKKSAAPDEKVLTSAQVRMMIMAGVMFGSYLQKKLEESR